MYDSTFQNYMLAGCQVDEVKEDYMQCKLNRQIGSQIDRILDWKKKESKCGKKNLMGFGHVEFVKRKILKKKQTE